MENETLANSIATLCYKHYRSLPKTGKPCSDGSEWTLLACYIQKVRDEPLKVVSLATGSKCIGQSKLSALGDILNDSHAEVLARRAFLRYLYDQIEIFQKTGISTIFEKRCSVSGKYIIQKKVDFYLFSSHIPCGDASIILKDSIPENHHVNDGISSDVVSVTKDLLKRKGGEIQEDETSSFNKVQKMSENELGLSSCMIIDIDSRKYVGFLNEDTLIGAIVKKCNDETSDVYRTGAKCVPSDSRQDSHKPGSDYHTVGAVRTKPGRGDPTLSVSCSDKMAKWNTVGMQGALLAHLIKNPIFPTKIIVGGGGPFSKKTMLRALVDRFHSTDVNVPDILHSSIVFEHSRYDKPLSCQPAPASIIWCAVKNKPLEIAVDGKKQGVTKKCKKNGALLVSKRNFFKMFHALTDEKFQSKTYLECKHLAEEYQKEWNLRKSQLGAWTVKPPELQTFQVSVIE